MIDHPSVPDRLMRWLDGIGRTSDPKALIWAGAAAAGIGDPIRQERLRRLAEMTARRSTEIGTLAMVLERIAWTEMMSGQIGAAGWHAAEGLELAGEATLTNSVCFHQAVLSWIAAVRGDAGQCLTLAGQAGDTARRHGLGSHLAIAGWAVGLHDMAEARGRIYQLAELVDHASLPYRYDRLFTV